MSAALSPPSGSSNALFSAGAEAIRWRADGTNPTTAIGHYLPANGSIEVFGSDMRSFKFIAVANTSDCFITYYGD